MLTHHHLKTSIALALALSLIAAPAATAHLLAADPPSCSACGYEVAAHPATSPPAHTPSAIVRVSSKSGFDWGDAGIGAAGVLAIAFVALGLTLAVRSSRPAPARQGSTSSRAPGM